MPKAISTLIIKYIPLQQGLRHNSITLFFLHSIIIKYIPLQQGLRPVIDVIIFCSF